MKITKTQLRDIIAEELQKTVLSEAYSSGIHGLKTKGDYGGTFMRPGEDIKIPDIDSSELIELAEDGIERYLADGGTSLDEIEFFRHVVSPNKYFGPAFIRAYKNGDISKYDLWRLVQKEAEKRGIEKQKATDKKKWDAEDEEMRGKNKLTRQRNKWLYNLGQTLMTDLGYPEETLEKYSKVLATAFHKDTHPRQQELLGSDYKSLSREDRKKIQKWLDRVLKDVEGAKRSWLGFGKYKESTKVTKQRLEAIIREEIEALMSEEEESTAKRTSKGNITQSTREKYATVGKDKFPIFDKESAEAAIDLRGHASESERARIINKAAKYAPEAAKKAREADKEK